ncbi:hypothetical protein PISMIDRAFT_681622, partial [Pisolithus microcarpus 441]
MYGKQFVLDFRGEKNDALYGLHGPQSSSCWRELVHATKLISCSSRSGYRYLPVAHVAATLLRQHCFSEDGSIIVDPLATSSGGFKPELTLSPALAGTMLVSSLLSCSDVWILWMIDSLQTRRPSRHCYHVYLRLSSSRPLEMDFHSWL